MAVEALAAEREALLIALRERAEAPDGLAMRIVAALPRGPQSVAEIAQDELLAELLVSLPVHPVWLELRMTELRRALLPRRVRETNWPLVSRLAIQCHLNEYAWATLAEEQDYADGLALRLLELEPHEIMLLACYRPLASLPGIEELLQEEWPEPVQAVLQEQVVAVLEERALAERMPAITPIRIGVSLSVRAQYEANPYPRWRQVTRFPVTNNLLGWPVPPAPEVLIAGCGTGRHAIETTQRYAGAKVLAVDLSRASLAYAQRKTREAGIDYISYAQADILELARSGRRFDIIECVGVLHHMADPFEGARALSAMLKPGGAMKLGLYSATARAGLKPAKALARRYGPATVRELRQAILAAPGDDPLRAPAGFRDFYSVSACRDLLMHVQEHEMGVDDLVRIAGENGLQLLGFVHTPQVKTAYRAMFPHDPHGRDFAGWAAFEKANPTTFGGMYQFWLHKPG